MIPNPGSPEAVKQGCICPTIDNCHGKGIPWPQEDGKVDPNRPAFWIRWGCPLHDKEE